MNDKARKVKKPKDDIWIPIYPGDYLADTTRLTTEQHGAYFLMILDYWKNGPIPNDDSVLIQITKLSSASLQKQKPILSAFFVEREGVFYHKRIEKERAEAAVRVEKYYERAVIAAKARWAKDDATSNATSNALSTAQAMPEAMLEDMLEECHSQSQSHSHSPSKNSPSISGEFLVDMSTGEVAA